MPAQQVADKRRGRPLLSVLFWAGVGLAPVAALILLLSEGSGPQRIAAVLAILAVVLIGLSITLRGDVETVRLDVEELLLDEIDGLRAEFRAQLEDVARATHDPLGEQVQRLQADERAFPPGAAVSGRVAGSDRGANEPGYDAGGRAYPQSAGASGGFAPRPGGFAPYSGQPVAHQQPLAGAARPVAAHVGMAGVAAMPPGVVRHTETVQVTTRQTIVDPLGDPAGAAGRSAAAGDWAVPGADTPRSGRYDERYDDDSWNDRPAGDQHGGVGRERPYDRDDRNGVDDHRPDLRSGDRWASVRSDGRGREVRMGERRAAIWTDGTGAELHIEDRWASVRREEPRRDEPRRERRRAEDRAGGAARVEDSWRPDDMRPDDMRPDDMRSDDRRSDRVGHDSRGPRPGAPALPAGDAQQVAGWARGWGEPEREPVWRGRPQRDGGQDLGYPSEGEAPWAGGAHGPRFEPSDGRWR